MTPPAEITLAMMRRAFTSAVVADALGAEGFTGQSPRAGHVNAWVLTPVTNPATGLDANQQVLQNQELRFVSSLAQTGAPTADGGPIWPRFRAGHDGDGDHDDLGLVMSPNAGGDSEATLSAQIRMAHHCAFWDSISPGPGGHGNSDD